MNVKLEAYVDKPNNRKGYIIERDGDLLKKSLFHVGNVGKLKAAILENLLDGLKECKSGVSHEDMLTVVVQNRHVSEWISNRDESKYKEYVSYMDDIFDTLEELDCRYRVIYLKTYGGKRFVTGEDRIIPSDSGLESMVDIEF